MKILMLGLNDPAGMMLAFSNAINRYTTHQSRFISFRTAYSLDLSYDIELPRLKDDDFSEIEHLLKTADIFHFHMLFDEHYQIGPLKVKDFVKGKGLLHHHHGTYDHQCFESLAANYEARYRAMGRKVLVSTPDLLQLLPVASWQPNLVPLFDIEYLPREEHLRREDVFKVVQAPTRKWHKHTAEFLRATARLKQRFPHVETQIIENMSYRECLKIKRSSHSVFDHMNGWFGISSLESLAQGVPTLAGLDAWNIRHISQFAETDDLPWLITRTELELEKTLSDLIESSALRESNGKQARQFMLKHWSEEKVISRLIETYQSL